MPRVLLRRCDAYEPDRIRGLLAESLLELGIKPHGRTLVKPNAVIAHRVLFPHAFTRPELLDGLLGALRAAGDETTRLGVGERCGITIPTRYAFAEAGYFPVLRRHRVPALLFDEMRQVPRALHSPGRLRDEIFIPEAVAETDFLVTVPKFKAHPWTKVTFNLKLYIGIQDDAHRLVDHDHHLHTKIVDLFEVIQPKLCVVDGIIAGGKTMLTPEPFPLGLLIIGDDAVATDAVCTHIAGLEPRSVDHLRMAEERGWGTLDLGAIDVGGDVTLEQARERARGFPLTLEQVDRQYNDRSNLRIYVGPPPDTYDYCWGGCPGALTETMGIIQQVQPKVCDEVRRLHLVYGAYQGEIPAAPGERVLFIGDCARWRGTVAGRDVDIPFLYADRHQLDIRRVKGIDLVWKLVVFFFSRFFLAGRQVLRTRGCTVSVAETVLLISFYGRTRNPYFDPRILFRFTWNYLVFRFMRLFCARRRPRWPAPPGASPG